MDPITFLGLLGSVASIASLFRAKGQSVTVEAIANEIIEDSEEVVEIDGALAQSNILSKVSREELEASVGIALSLYDNHRDFLNRITGRCLSRYNDAVRDHNMEDSDLQILRHRTGKCVCQNVTMAVRDAGGDWPSPEFKKLWERFDCGLL